MSIDAHEKAKDPFRMDDQQRRGRVSEKPGVVSEVPASVHSSGAETDTEMPQHLQALQKANEVLAQRRSNLPTVVLQVKDRDHARSEEVLAYCVEELKSGTTYNDLRLKLGLGPASHDIRWREIRELLVEMILPDSEEEAIKSEASLSGYILQKVERFLEKVEKRALVADAEQEPALLKLELESMKLLLDKYSKRTDHFLKMKDLKSKEKRTTGTTIIFQNLHTVRRPGDPTPMEDAAKLVVEAKKIK